MRVRERKTRVQTGTGHILGHGRVLLETHKILPGIDSYRLKLGVEFYLGKKYGILEPQNRVPSTCADSICGTGIW